jgi:aspartyl protease
MMSQAEQYPFVTMDPTLGAASLLPYLPVMLTFRQRSVSVMGLLDSAATVNVLPSDVGRQLGAVWEEQTTAVQLTGNLAQQEARVLVVSATVGKFAPVRLAFAWTQSNAVPVLLGQVNFFMEFDVCLFRSRSLFEVKPK